MRLSNVILRYAAVVAYSCLIGSTLACAQSTNLTILHTNDLHASFLPHEAQWVRADKKPLVGGFLELSWMIDSLRKAKGTTLLLDGGDVMTGSPISEIDYMGSAGGGLFAMMNEIGYDAWTVGNHDLDISQDNLREHVKIAKFATLSANLQDSLGNLPFGQAPYVIVKKDGLRIGIIGLITRELFEVTNTNNLRGLKLASSHEVVQSIIDRISAETDLIIALTHQGVYDDSVLAVSTRGLNVIIGGHSHTRMKAPKRINDVVISQAGSNCENLGELELTIENKKVTAFRGQLLPLWVSHSYKEGPLANLVREFSEKIDAEYNEVIGTLQTDWTRASRRESNVGNFVSDAIREGASADMAVTNSSGIRRDVSAGPLQKLDVFELLPFRNMLCTFTLSGSEVRAFAQRYATGLIDGSASTQLSGLRCEWKNVNGEAVISKLTIRGTDVVDTASYTCATSDFLINQGSKYLGMTPSNVVYSMKTIFQVVVDKARTEKNISSTIENRFQELH